MKRFLEAIMGMLKDNDVEKFFFKRNNTFEMLKRNNLLRNLI